MRRMKMYENRGGFHTYRSAESLTAESCTARSGKIHTGVCGASHQRVYVTQVAAQNKSSARPGAGARASIGGGC